MRAGKGGGIGESGEGGKLSHVSLFIKGTPNDFEIMAIDNLPDGTSIQTYPPADGGLAGMIAEGSVTITNYSSGTSIGRS